MAIVDDYQNVALTMADWSRVESKAEVTVFTGHLSESGPAVDATEFKDQRSQGIPLGRLARTRGGADAVVFLASDLSSFTTGVVLPRRRRLQPGLADGSVFDRR
jgi:NAD(P)-dependent dehydrogenase (short-subunit alcohol dehydrogenase family)